jgi:hypothetical protein
MAALGARPRRTSGIDRHDKDARQPGLVLHEGPELEERPAPGAGPLRPGNRRPLADPLEILEGDAAIGAFGLGDEPFADGVISRRWYPAGRCVPPPFPRPMPACRIPPSSLSIFILSRLPPRIIPPVVRQESVLLFTATAGKSLEEIVRR